MTTPDQGIQSTVIEDGFCAHKLCCDQWSTVGDPVNDQYRVNECKKCDGFRMLTS